MKKIFRLLIVLAVICMAAPAGAQNIRDILGGIASGGGNSDGGNSGLGEALGSFINNTLANNNFTVDDLVGTWNYQSPGVTFESDNTLQNLGGAAAATALENQLEDYYRRLGFNRTSLVVTQDHKFTLKLGLVTLKGDIVKDESDRLVFKLNALGKVQLGSLSANATKSGDTLKITFDATKLISVLNKVAGAVNNSTLSALSGILSSYDGVYIGFKLKAQK